jgi:hypothetical protein
MIQSMTGHFDRRVIPLQEIADVYGITATDKTISAAFARYGYYYHMPGCKPFLSYEH